MGQGQRWARMCAVLDDVVRFLACPHCGESLARHGGSLRCRRGHTFDIARQGYVSLLPGGGKRAGDTAAMVRARGEFLAAGHFAQLAAALAESAAEAAGTVPGDACVVDVGAGTGYYLAAILDALPDRAGLALDASRFALRRAARAHRRIGAAACDVWRGLPVADGAAALILNVFAPRNGPELARIAAPGGRLLVITPTRLHMTELIRALGLLTVDRRKEERLARTLDPYFTLTEKRDIRSTMSLGHHDVLAAVMMGPSAWQAGQSARQSSIGQLPDPFPVTLSVTLWSHIRSAR
jgi:23S rRNA (guanine745-N1)-methyltransferase